MNKRRKNRKRNSIHTSRRGGDRPKGKGYIRFALLLIIISVFINKVINKSEKNDSTSENTPKIEAPSKQNTVKAKPLKKLTKQDVNKITRTIPPLLNSAVDTISWKHRKYIRYFSIDTTLQNVGNIYMRRYHPMYGAAVILQPKTGRVLAMVSYNNPEEPKIADDLYLKAEFAAASVFKTVTAAAAIEKSGFTEDTKLKLKGKSTTLYQKTQLVEDLKPPYREVTFKQAYARSINPVFGRIGIYNVGKTALTASAQKFGFNAAVPFELPVQVSQYHEPNDDFYNLAEIACGFNNVTTLSPILGSLIAASIANNGKMMVPTIIDSIVDLKTGQNLYTRESRVWRIVMEKSGVPILKNLMRGTTAFGSARKSFRDIKNSSTFKRYQYGGKTGTKDTVGVGNEGKARIEWFIGFMQDSSQTNDKTIACGVFQALSPLWQVHSSYIGAKMMEKEIRLVLKREKIAAQKAEEERVAREKAIKDSIKAYNDSIKIVRDSIARAKRDSIKAFNDSTAKIKEDSIPTIKEKKNKEK